MCQRKYKVQELGILFISVFSWFVILSKVTVFFFFSAVVDGGGREEGVVWKVAALPMPCYIVL